MTGKRGVALLTEIREAGHAGKPLPTEATREMAGAIDQALATGETLEGSLGLAGGWRAHLAALLQQAVGQPKLAPGQISAAARARHADLTRYVESGQFDQDLNGLSQPTGARRDLYEQMLGFKGRVPDERTLRRWLSP